MSCQWVNQNGVRCGMPAGHGQDHGNGLLTSGRDTWICPEPQFVGEVPEFKIKYSDPAACAIMRVWISIASSLKKPDGNGVMVRAVGPEKIAGVEVLLEECRVWQEKNGTKVPD